MSSRLAPGVAATAATAAQTALAIGLDVEPGTEALWRLRLLAVHNSRNVDAFEETVTKLHHLVDELGGDLEPETEELLAQLRRPSTGPDTLGHLA